MLIPKVKLTLLNAMRREGTRKDGQPYLFYAISFLDSESNVLKMNLGNELSKNKTLTTKLDISKQIPCTVDIMIHPTGFNLKGTIVKVDF